MNNTAGNGNTELNLGPTCQWSATSEHVFASVPALECEGAGDLDDVTHAYLITFHRGGQNGSEIIFGRLNEVGNTIGREKVTAVRAWTRREVLSIVAGLATMAEGMPGDAVTLADRLGDALGWWA